MNFPIFEYLSPIVQKEWKLTCLEKLRPSHTSSFLRAGSRFTGKQKSDRQEYNVEVEMKHVDMNESFLCGYLRIEGIMVMAF